MSFGVYIALAITADKADSRSFKESNLIYVLTRSSGRSSPWISVASCVWEGPESLRYTPRLVKEYSKCKELFQDILEIKDADIRVLFKEIETIKPLILKYILQLFQDAEKLFEKTGKIEMSYTDLRTPIFPVYDTDKPNTLKLRGCHPWLPWWIADGEIFRKVFHGKVELLAFSDTDLRRMPCIVRAFDLNPRKLSVAAKISLSEHQGSQPLSLQTNQFIDRIKLMRR